MKKNYFLVSLILVLLGFNANAQLTAPFIEEFNSGFPTTWSQTATTGGPWTTGGTLGYNASTVADHTGTAGSLFTWLDYSGTDAGVIMASDTIDVSSVPRPELSFWFNNNLGTNPCDPFNSLFVEAYDGAAWVIIDQIQQDNLGIWSEHYYDLCAFILPGDKVLVRFRGEAGGTVAGYPFYHDLAIDDISVDTLRVNCFQPQGLRVAAITDNSATAKWSTGCSDTAWTVTYGLAGFAIGTGTDSTVMVDTLDLSSLADLTAYEFYVRGYCTGGDTSAWAGPFAFTTLPTCVEPDSLAVFSILDTAAGLTWAMGNGQNQDTAWSVKYGPAGFNVLTGGTYVHTNVDTITATGLMAITTYDYYVRGYCNNGDTSIWVGPFTFTTKCASYIPTYTEDFTTMNFSAVPNCWEEGQGLMTVNSTIAIGTSNWGSDNFANVTGGSNAAYLNLWTTNRNDWLISPSIDLGAGTLPYQIEFDIAFTDYAAAAASSNGLGADDKIALLISTDNGNTWSDTNILIIWDSSNTAPSFAGQFVAFNLTAAGYSGLVRFAFYAESTIYNEDNDLSIDNFAVRFVPTCPRPLNFRTTSLYSDSVNITWDSIATDSNYFLEYGAPGFALGSGTPLNSANDTTFINGLTPNTTYEVYIRTFCDLADTSLWTGPLSFTTPCASFIPPYSEDFTTYAFNNNPACWEEASGLLTVNSTLSFGNSLWTNRASFGNNGSGNNAAVMNIYFTGRTEWLVSPSIDLGNGTTPYQVEFDVAITDYFNSSPPSAAGGLMGPDDKLVLVISTDNGNTWSDTNILAQWDTSNMPSNTGDYFYYDLTANGYTGEVRFGLYAESTISNEDNDAFIDNFAVVQVPTCPRPLNLTFDSASQTTANVSWTNGANDVSWILEYGAPGFTQGTGTIGNAPANPAVISGLSPSTCYDVYLRSVCGAGDSSLWIGPLRFCTDCAPVTDLCEDFEAYNAGELPICWEKFIVTTGSSTVGINTFGGNLAPNGVQLNAGNDGTSTMFLISPEMTALSAGTHRVSFWVDGSFTPDTALIIGTISDPTNPGTFVPVDTIKTITNAYQRFRVPIPAPTDPLQTRIAFQYIATSTFRSMTIDDFCFELIPSCEKAPFPTILDNGVNSSSLSLGWNIDTNHASYVINYGPAGYDPVTNTAGEQIGTTTVNFFNATGLNSLTDYCFWIKSICSNGDTSEWAGPFCGKSGCALSTPLPYFENFDSYTTVYPAGKPLCWEEGQGVYTSGTVPAIQNSQWVPDGFGNVGTTGAARMEIWTTGRNEWLISPSLDLGAVSERHIRVEYDVAATVWNTTAPATFGDDDSLVFMISRNNGVSWDNSGILAVYDTSNVPSATGNTVIFDLPGESGIVKFAFYATSKVSNQDNNVYIDNFKVYDSAYSSIKEVAFDENFSVYPNPNNGVFTILNEGASHKSSVKLIDIQGRVVYENQMYFTKNGRKQIEVDNLTSGVYILIMQSEGRQEQHRVIVE